MTKAQSIFAQVCAVYFVVTTVAYFVFDQTLPAASLTALVWAVGATIGALIFEALSHVGRKP